MKNKFGLTFGLAILLISILGCSSYNPLAGSSDAPNSNSGSTKTADESLTDTAIESTIGDVTTGVPECDELLDSISEESKNQTDGYATKAMREFTLNRIRESVKKSLEENKSDKAELAKNCADFRKQLTKFKAEEEGKTGK